MLITESITGLPGETLVREGALDDTALVRDIIPETGGSVFATATLRQVMDMTTDVTYSEDYAAPNADMLGWIIDRVTGNSVTRLACERLWRRMGLNRTPNRPWPST